MKRTKEIHGVNVTVFTDINEYNDQNEIDCQKDDEGFNIKTNHGAAAYGLFNQKILCFVPSKHTKMDMIVNQCVDKMWSDSDKKADIINDILEFIES